MKQTNQNTGKPRRKLTALWVTLAIAAALIILWGVLMVSSTFFYTTTIDINNLEYRDPVTQTLSDGNTAYTPGRDHVVMDNDRTILYYNNLLLVFTIQDLDETAQNALAGTVGGEVVGSVSGAIHALQILVPDSTLAQLETMAQTLMAQDQVMYASSEYPVQIMGTASGGNPWDTTDSEDVRGDEAAPGGSDWWAEAIGAYTAWSYTDLCQPIRVGIADSGVRGDHEDLAGQVTCINPVSHDWFDEHGTHVAGIIGAANNDLGIRGIADTAQLYSYDLWPEEDENSYHTMAEYLAAINFMAENGVRVVNNSWGCLLPSERTFLAQKYGRFALLGQLFAHSQYARYLDQRLNEDLAITAEASIAMLGQLIDSGYEDFIIVQAAGNENTDARYNGFFSTVTPALYQSMNPVLLDTLTAQGITYEQIDQRILIVGAVEHTTNEAGEYLMTVFSNYGETVDICAPGFYIYSSVLPGEYQYDYFDGTSMAAPMVTGSVAFIWSLDPELSAEQVRSILLDNTVTRAYIDIGDETYTYPMLNVGRAAQAVVGG